MSALMVLMAGLTVGSDETERILAETEQRLAIAGYWEGTGEGNLGTVARRTVDVQVESGFLLYKPRGGAAWIELACQWVDEGNGKCRFLVVNPRTTIRRELEEWWDGIYKREAGCLTISLRKSNKGRQPLAVQSGDDHLLLILKRVKLPKK